jgi:hypothetical protein
LFNNDKTNIEFINPKDLNHEISADVDKTNVSNKIQKPKVKIVHHLKELEIDIEETKKVQKSKSVIGSSLTKSQKLIENETTKELRVNKQKRLSFFKKLNYNFRSYDGLDDLMFPENGPHPVPVTPSDPVKPLNLGGYKKIEELEEFEMKLRTDFIGFERLIN